MKYMVFLFILLSGCLSKDQKIVKSDIKIENIHHAQDMYGGEKIYNANLISNHSLKKIAEDNAYPISKIVCRDERYTITGGIDLDTEEKKINDYRYSVYISICKNEDCNINIENQKINAVCNVELSKNYSNKKYSTNTTILNKNNFDS